MFDFILYQMDKVSTCPGHKFRFKVFCISLGKTLRVYEIRREFPETVVPTLINWPLCLFSCLSTTSVTTTSVWLLTGPIDRHDTCRDRGQTQWTIRRAFPPSADPLTITKVTQFVYIVVMVDPILSYNHHYTKILLSIQILPNTSCLLVRPRQLCVVNQR